MIALFENCSFTSEEKGAPVKPLEITSSCERAFHLVKKHIEDKGYYGLKTNNAYYEIYYWYLGFEVTISFSQRIRGNKTVMNMMVYGKNKRGRTRKMLKLLMEEYGNLLKTYIN